MESLGLMYTADIKAARFKTLGFSARAEFLVVTADREYSDFNSHSCRG